MKFVLSDGLREYDLLAGGAVYVALEGLNLPIPAVEDTFAESSESEGRVRVRSRALNPEVTFTVFVRGADGQVFWDAIDDFQELVASAHRRKGTLVYEPPSGGSELTFDLESIRVTGLPQRSWELAQFRGSAEVTFETRPYARLEPKPVVLDVESIPAVNYLNTMLDYGDCLIALPLGATNGLEDRANSNDGTGAGSITVGGFATGPLGFDDEGATSFDGSDDAVSTSLQPHGNSALTFSGFARRATSADNRMIFGGSELSPCFLVNTSGDLVYRRNGSTNISEVVWSGAAPAVGSWFHWALTLNYGTSQVSLYVNGSFVSTGTLMSAGSTTGTFQVGRRDNGAGTYVNYWIGEQAWVTVHTKVLTGGQIADAYAAALSDGSTDVIEHTTVELAGPVDSITVEGVGGQVDAFGLLSVEDVDSEARHFLEIGRQDEFDPDDPEPLLLKAITDLTALSGTSQTRSGSVSTNVLRGNLSAALTAICSTGSQPHKGPWKPRVRVYGSSADIVIQFQWRRGAGPWNENERWLKLPAANNWFDLDCGTLDIGELPEGHSWEGRIVAKALTGVPTLDVDTVQMMPAGNYFVGRGRRAQVSLSAQVASDGFNQTAGALTGKTPDLTPSGNWSGAGDSDDFQVTGSGLVHRYAISDSAANNGRYCRLGSGTLTNTTITYEAAPFDVPFNWSSDLRFGVFARYTDTNNWLMVVETQRDLFQVIKRVSGTETLLGQFTLDTASRHMVVSVTAAGGIAVVANGKWVFVTLTGDTDLATAGALASGGYGIYHANATGLATPGHVGIMSSFAVTGSGSTVEYPVLHPDRVFRLAHDGAVTESADGTQVGETPIREGSYLRLPPSTRAGLKSRLVVRSRRFDINAGLPDVGLTDSVDVSLDVTERVTLA